MAQSSYPGSSGSGTTSGTGSTSSGTSQRTSTTGSSYSGMSDRASEQVRSGMQSAEKVAGRVMDQGREVSEGMQQVAGNFKTAVDRSVREQPMATLAMAAIAGFVLGAIWKS